MGAEQLVGSGSSPQTDSDKSISSHLSMALVQHCLLVSSLSKPVITSTSIKQELWVLTTVVVYDLQLIGLPAKHNIKCEIARVM